MGYSVTEATTALQMDAANSLHALCVKRPKGEENIGGRRIAWSQTALGGVSDHSVHSRDCPQVSQHLSFEIKVAIRVIAKRMRS